MFGYHTIIDLHDCNVDIISSERGIKKFLSRLLIMIGMTIHNNHLYMERYGNTLTYGYTLIAMINTSSITMHFDEERKTAYIDLFSCKRYNEEDVYKLAKESFEAKDFNYRFLERV